MLNNNRHNQLVVTRQKWSEPDIILVEFFFSFFYLCVGWGCQILTPSPFNLSCCCSFSPFCLSPSLSQSLSLPTLRSRLLGFLAEHRDRRKKKKKKQKVESMKDILVEVCNLLLLCKLPTRCAQTQSRAVALALSKAATMARCTVGVSQQQGDAVILSVNS